MSQLRFAFAGDRNIALWVLEYLQGNGNKPVALLVSEAGKASHANELIRLCPDLTQERILKGRQFQEPQGVELLTELELDYLICVHFPYIVPKKILEAPKRGVLNLHPAYLPFNRGWHTPSWAILEETPIGATLHFMDQGIDTGPIVHQKMQKVSPGDTADTLYQKLKQLELEVFREAWPMITSKNYQTRSQALLEGTTHKRRELFKKEVQQIDLDQYMIAADLLRKMRALTTNDVTEGAYYETEGKRFRVQLTIVEEVIDSDE